MEIRHCNICGYPGISADILLYRQIFVLSADTKSYTADNRLNHIYLAYWCDQISVSAISVVLYNHHFAETIRQVLIAFVY